MNDTYYEIFQTTYQDFTESEYVLEVLQEVKDKYPDYMQNLENLELAVEYVIDSMKSWLYEKDMFSVKEFLADYESMLEDEMYDLLLKNHETA